MRVGNARGQLIGSAYNNLVRSPLRHFPGPLLAKLSDAWLITITFSGRRAFIIHALHQRYGPVVRIAPNELCFSSAAAAHDIYLGVDDDTAAAAEDETQSSGVSSLSGTKGKPQRAESNVAVKFPHNPSSQEAPLTVRGR